MNPYLSAATDAMSGLDAVWILIGAALVFFMQAGFAMVEAGFTRAKNSGNIIMKNLMDFALGTIVFWLLGYGLMMGSDNGGFIGTPSWQVFTGTDEMVKLIWATVFCATAATIVSGAMAERTKFSCYCVYSIAISLLVYPIEAHWIWGGGWLTNIGGTAFHDFAGSTVVHMVGGTAALIGAIVLGPRIGKYGKDGKPRAIPGHSITLGALGVFILWFGWFGFNGSSTYGIPTSAGDLGTIFVTTNLAPAVAATTCMIITWIRYKKPDVSMCLNGVLAGLVGITAGTDTVTPAASAIIGLICGFVVVFGVELLDKKFKVDDPVGAVAVHGMCGLVGTLCVGIFADPTVSASAMPGLWGAIAGHNTWAEGFTQLGVQLLGIVAVLAWVCVTMIPLFLLLKKYMKLRVTREEEIGGLDFYEHNLASAYAGFDISDNIPMDEVPGEVAKVVTDQSGQGKPSVEEVFPDGKSVPPTKAAETTKAAATTKAKAVSASERKLTKVSIVCKKTAFEKLKKAMNDIGVSGMTVTEAMGCGMQKGSTEFYRGVPVEMTLNPKLKVEIVVSAIPVDTVVNAARNALYTGNIGDGKIFVYEVDNVVKIRTGEEGFDALQDD